MVSISLCNYAIAYSYVFILYPCITEVLANEKRRYLNNAFSL